MSTPSPTSVERCVEATMGMFKQLHDKIKATSAAHMDKTLDYLQKISATINIPDVGNIFDGALLTLSGLSQEQEDAVKAWKKDKKDADKAAMMEQQKRNRLRSSPRFVKYPKPLVDVLQLNKAPGLDWVNRFLGGTGYIDRIRRSDIKDDKVVKGVDCCKRPFVVFVDKNDMMCVLFQRYEPGEARDLAGENPLWVGIPREREVFQEGWHAFPVSKMDEFAKRLAKYLPQANTTTNLAGKRRRE